MRQSSVILPTGGLCNITTPIGGLGAAKIGELIGAKRGLEVIRASEEFAAIDEEVTKPDRGLDVVVGLAATGGIGCEGVGVGAVGVDVEGRGQSPYIEFA